jgi:hypothetical protein
MTRHKTNNPSSWAGAILLAAGLAGEASATLINRGGGLIYDTDLNITWLQDANYAQTSGYDGDGLMNWSAATTWASNLVYGGYDDWRLPTTTDTGAPGAQCTNNGTDCGYNVDPGSSELAHLFFVELGNLSAFDTSGSFRGGSPGVDWGVVHTGPFVNLQSNVYWSGTEYAPYPGDAWLFVTRDGLRASSVRTLGSSRGPCAPATSPPLCRSPGA